MHDDTEEMSSVAVISVRGRSDELPNLKTNILGLDLES